MSGRIYPLLAGLFLACCLPAAVAAEPWRLDDRHNLDWLDLSGALWIRGENLDGQFRAGLSGGDQMLTTRTSVHARARHGAITYGLEVMDTRAMLDDAGTPLDTGIVNALEPIQAYIEWQAQDVLRAGSQSRFRLGRMDLNLGSRRLAARHGYRIVVNTFSGIDWNWSLDENRSLRSFFTLPMIRRPSDREALGDNEIRLDKAHPEVRFWGLLYTHDELFPGVNAEVYLYGLDERDAADLATRNRDLLTPGFRVYREPVTGQFDYQFESVLQVGDSRASSSATDARDLDHSANHQRLEIGYSFDAPWQPRLLFQYDYVSGDKDPGDNGNERFDSLFGAGRFDFGPGRIYGPFGRVNISSPGLRLQLKPAAAVDAFISLRDFRLASSHDTWSGGGLRDPSGNSSSHVGRQIEFRVRHNVLPGNLRLELGGAWLFAGEFMKNAPGNTGEGDAGFIYSQMQLNF